MTSEELLDFYDDNYEKIGTTTRREVHAKGLWHATFHCWVVDRNRQLIFLQQRSEQKADWPLYFDITCAGHLGSGETVEDGIRELKEELGFDVEFASLEKVETIPETFVKEDWIDKEFSHVFLCTIDFETVHWALQIEEVKRIVSMPIADFKVLVTGETEFGIAKCIFTDEQIDISHKEMVYYSDNYWQTLIKKL
ncbi:MAG: NUDIX hydrolase [Bacilli bacterium]